MRFRSKDISLERLHPQTLPCMHAKFGVSYRRMKLPVFDGVQEALTINLQRKRGLEREKTTPVTKRRIELKREKEESG